MSEDDAQTGSEAETDVVTFRDLNLPAPLLSALEKVGYETPSPIQAQTIPHLLDGCDVLGHAPTGTGKTAAFALPLLARLDPNTRAVQVLVLAPTRELAIQVSEAFQRYASQLKDFHVLPVYGGTDYGGQIRALKRGVQVVVGTPGRIMDHMRKGTLKLNDLRALVLDEADEMLRMGFIDDVDWILEQTPDSRQIALFSATMPKEVERIAKSHLTNPYEIQIKTRTATAETIRQRYWYVSGMHKLDALTRILEVEEFDAIIMFVRTKMATVELADKLEARGYAAAAINGDLPQKQREQMVNKLKNGGLDILVATDVAARGLDVERISHVVNYDIPTDIEAYIHRIGRTGRAGRSGEAILFVSPREKRLLHAIERTTRQKIEELTLPSTEVVNNKRIASFKQRITDTLAAGELAFLHSIVEQYEQEHDVPAAEIAAALAKMSLGEEPLLLKPGRNKQNRQEQSRDRDGGRGRERDFGHRNEGRRDDRGPKRKDARRDDRGQDRGPDRNNDRGQERPRRQTKDSYGIDMEPYRVDVGHEHGVKPGNLVGAIANEAGLDSEHIGRIDIHDDYSVVDLPAGMPKEIFRDLKKAWVCGRKLNISAMGEKRQTSGPSFEFDEDMFAAEAGDGDSRDRNARNKPAHTGKTPVGGKTISKSSKNKPKRKSGGKFPKKGAEKFSGKAGGKPAGKKTKPRAKLKLKSKKPS